MFSRFQFILNDYQECNYHDFFYESSIKQHMEKGEELYQNSVTTSRENLEKFFFPTDILMVHLYRKIGLALRMLMFSYLILTKILAK